jgi:hypothetical protein
MTELPDLKQLTEEAKEGRDLFAAVRSLVNIGRRQGLSAFDSILAALNPLQSLLPLS